MKNMVKTMSGTMAAKLGAKNCCAKGAIRIIQQSIWRQMHWYCSVQGCACTDREQWPDLKSVRLQTGK